MNNWELMISGVKYEVPPETIRQWIAEGRVLGDDRVRVPGRDWARAQDVPELRSSFQVQAPAVMIPPPPLPSRSTPQPPASDPAKAAPGPFPGTGQLAPPTFAPPAFAPPGPPGMAARPDRNPKTKLALIGIALVGLLIGGYFLLPYLGIDLSGSTYDRQFVGYGFKRGNSTAYVQVSLPQGWKVLSESRHPYRIDPNYWVEAYNARDQVGFLLSSRDVPPENQEQRDYLKNTRIEELAEWLYKETRGSATQLKDVSTDEAFSTDVTSVNGRQAQRQTLSGKDGMTIFRMHYYVIRGEHGVHVLCLWSPDKQFDANQGIFKEIVESFRESTTAGFKFSHRIVEDGTDGTEFIFVSDSPVAPELGNGLTADGEKGSKLAAGGTGTVSFNGRKFTLRHDEAVQEKLCWPVGEKLNRKVIIRLDSL
jgi:hypothetical protein